MHLTAWTAWACCTQKRVVMALTLCVFVLRLSCRAFAIYHKRLRWSTLKSRKVVLDVVN